MEFWHLIYSGRHFFREEARTNYSERMPIGPVPGILESGMCRISLDSSVHSAFNEPKIVENTQRVQKLCPLEGPESVPAVQRAEIFTENTCCLDIR